MTHGARTQHRIRDWLHLDAKVSPALGQCQPAPVHEVLTITTL